MTPREEADALKRHFRLACWGAHKFGRRIGLPFDDARQEAQIGILKALRNFDPAKGTFGFYARVWMRKEIYTAAMRDRTITVPWRKFFVQGSPDVTLGLSEEWATQEMLVDERLAIQTALRRLPERSAAIVLLRDVEGRHLNEIAAEVSLCRKTISTLHASAMVSMRKELTL